LFVEWIFNFGCKGNGSVRKTTHSNSFFGLN